jgi:DNA-binding response OmpR family regulator
MTRIFMVDDSPIVTRMVSQFLLDRGYEVETTNSPFGASGRLVDYKPDVVLMDLGLPGLSGHKLIDLIKKRGGELDCKVVLFSSTNEQEMKDMVAGGLADDYFVKGNSLNELESKLRRLVSRRATA